MSTTGDDSFDSLLNRYARSRDGDSLNETIRRAENGIRMVGAAVVSTAATLQPAPGPAALMLRLLKRPLAGSWARATRVGLYLLAAAHHPLAVWAGLRESSFDGRGRPIDRWLTEYETSLRHGGRNPPALAEQGLRETLAADVVVLCQRLCEHPGVELPIEGSGEETRLNGAPCAPFLTAADRGLLLWDGVAGRRGGRWIDAETDESIERRETNWEVGAAALLRELGGDDPFAPFLGEGDTAAETTSGQLTVFTTPGGDPLELAEHLAARRRSRSRPVIVVPLIDSDAPLSALRLMVGDDPRLSNAGALQRLKDWNGKRPLVLFAGAAVDAPTALALEEALAATAALGVVTRQHVLARWPPEVRRRFALVGDDGRLANVPEPVRAQLAANRPPDLAWAYSAMAHFDVADRPSMERFLRLRSGLLDPLQDDVVREWWERGDLLVGADGRVSLADRGWAALAEGLAGVRSAEASDAWRGGVWLAAHVAEKRG